MFSKFPVLQNEKCMNATSVGLRVGQNEASGECLVPMGDINNGCFEFRLGPSAEQYCTSYNAIA